MRCFINLRGGRDHFGVIKQALRFIVPPLIIHLQAIILFYKPNKKTWQFSLGIPSNTANILYENNLFCYSLKLPKFLSRLSLLKRTPLQRQLYKQCLFSHSIPFFDVWQSSFLHSLFLLFCWGGMISIILGYKGGGTRKDF